MLPMPARPLPRLAGAATLAALLASGLALDAVAQSRSDALLAPTPTPTPTPAAAPAANGDSPVPAAELGERLARLERMLNERSLSDFVLQLQQLQQEMQELRGLVELQQHQLRQAGITVPQFGQSYAEQKAAAEAGEAADGEPAAAEGAAAGEAAEGTDAAAVAADAVPIAPPPKTGVGALGGGGDLGGTLALPSPETLEGGEQDAYRRAFELLKDRDYDGAKKELAAMLVQYPQGQYTDNGVYWLGEIGYVTKDYPAALTHFNRLVSDYPGSPKLPAAMLKLGYIYQDQQDTEQARKMLQAVNERFPDTTEGRLAKGRLEQMSREGG
jgi:tol-pal system protein YbgF